MPIECQFFDKTHFLKSLSRPPNVLQTYQSYIINMQVTVLTLGTREESMCWFSYKKIAHPYFGSFLKNVCAQTGLEGHFSNQGLLL